MFFSEITTATSGNTSMANTVKSHEYALAVCTEKDNFDGFIFEGELTYKGGCGGGGIFGKKNTSICNLLNLLFFLFSNIRHIM